MKRINKYIGAALLGFATLAIPSCSDTWDDHYNGIDEGTSANKTLWELICERPELSRFKQIAEKSTYYRDETRPQENYTFKDMLNGSMLITAWVPENDAFTEAEFNDWMEMAETRGFTVQQQLMANSIALYRHVATGGGIDTLAMLNGKKLEFNKNDFTMQYVPMQPYNIAATNGTLHIVKTPLPFKYNLYEYLKDERNAAANNVGIFHDFVVQNDTTYFDENRSVEGNPDINGDPTYVDSVYIITNTMFRGTHSFPNQNNTDKFLTYDESFGANLVGEDSTFIMLYPTDAAWEAAKQKLERLYNYAEKYVDKEKFDLGGDSKSTLYRDVTNPDSLKEKNIAMDIASPLCFNLHFQPNAGGQIGRWKLDDFMAEKGQSAEYFLNTFGDTLRSDANWDKSSLLEGKQIDVSNGVAIIKDEWDFPLKLYQPDLYVEVGYRSFFNTGKATGNFQAVPFSNVAAEAWIDSVGRVSEDNFYYIWPNSASGNPKFDFKLVGTHGENRESDVMSGKYDIYVVMVPDFYITSSDTIIGDTVKHKIVATLNYTNGNPNGNDASLSTDVIEYLGEKVDTILLFENFEFPYSYKNMRQCYPTLSLTTKTTSKERREGYSNSFCIDRFILRSKED